MRVAVPGCGLGLRLHHWVRLAESQVHPVIGTKHTTTLRPSSYTSRNRRPVMPLPRSRLKVFRALPWRSGFALLDGLQETFDGTELLALVKSLEEYEDQRMGSMIGTQRCKLKFLELFHPEDGYPQEMRKATFKMSTPFIQPLSTVLTGYRIGDAVAHWIYSHQFPHSVGTTIRQPVPRYPTYPFNSKHWNHMKNLITLVDNAVKHLENYLSKSSNVEPEVIESSSATLSDVTVNLIKSRKRILNRISFLTFVSNYEGVALGLNMALQGILDIQSYQAVATMQAHSESSQAKADQVIQELGVIRGPFLGSLWIDPIWALSGNAMESFCDEEIIVASKCLGSDRPLELEDLNSKLFGIFFRVAIGQLTGLAVARELLSLLESDLTRTTVEKHAHFYHPLREGVAQERLNASHPQLYLPNPIRHEEEEQEEPQLSSFNVSPQALYKEREEEEDEEDEGDERRVPDQRQQDMEDHDMAEDGALGGSKPGPELMDVDPGQGDDDPEVDMRELGGALNSGPATEDPSVERPSPSPSERGDVDFDMLDGRGDGSHASNTDPPFKSFRFLNDMARRYEQEDPRNPEDVSLNNSPENAAVQPRPPNAPTPPNDGSAGDDEDSDNDDDQAEQDRLRTPPNDNGEGEEDQLIKDNSRANGNQSGRKNDRPSRKSQKAAPKRKGLSPNPNWVPASKKRLKLANETKRQPTTEKRLKAANEAKWQPTPGKKPATWKEVSSRPGNKSAVVEFLVAVVDEEKSVGAIEISPNPTSVKHLTSKPKKLFNPDGSTEECTITVHHPEQLRFFNEVIDRMYKTFDGPQSTIPLHVGNREQSMLRIMTETEYDALDPKDVHSILAQEKVILINECQDRGMEFGLEQLRLIGALDDPIFVQDQSADAPRSYTQWGRSTTFRQFHDIVTAPKKQRRALNALGLPGYSSGPTDRHLDQEQLIWDISNQIPGFTPKLFPSYAKNWSIVGGGGACHPWHNDSHGAGTFIKSNSGLKVWCFAHDINTGEPSTSFLKSDVWEAGPELRVETVLLRPGMRIIMPPGMPHAVFTIESSVCSGGHYYTWSTMEQTLHASIRSLILEETFTNTNDHASEARQMLVRMMGFLHEEMILRDLTNDDNHLLPSLDTAEDWTALSAFFCYIKLSNVLALETYGVTSDPEVQGRIAKKNWEKIHSGFDANALLHTDRHALVWARGLMQHAIIVLSRRYNFNFQKDLFEPMLIHYLVFMKNTFETFFSQQKSQGNSETAVFGPDHTRTMFYTQIEWILQSQTSFQRLYDEISKRDASLSSMKYKWWKPSIKLQRKPGQAERQTKEKYFEMGLHEGDVRYFNILRLQYL